ncbi:MAG: cysteine--tRNA ligase [Ignavibacteria bacterium RBG_16_34_14]|nr:MAG: cysteine--tRNA ligase [Ignavibacteria bacterium RBG_16_34_14]
MLKIYNTLSKQKEEFKPINPPNVNMYVCGPTVYDYFHIGNARSFISSDIIRRYLEYMGYKVKFVMNLTDVDDKIIKKSNEEKIDSKIIAEKYINAFFEDVEKLKMKKADIYPKATEHMDDIIEMIKELEQKGFAYNVDGNVFYDVGKFKEYGKLSGKKIDELESGSRVEVNVEKKNPLDFALWKKAKEGEPYWESPWGNGRPGWHIECSAMSCKHLGVPPNGGIDIHAGGNDLIFPHHENEIAQSEAANGKKFVNYWIHFGFLNLDNEKMSKSLGNFFTARDVLKKYSAEAIRLLFAQTNYGGPLNFSDELLSSAEKGLEKINNLAQKIEDEIKTNSKESINPDFDFQKYENEFTRVMDDDFNTPQGVAVIFDFVKEVNRTISENENINVKFYKNAKSFLEKTAEGILGILDFDNLSKTSDGKLEGDLIEFLIQLRTDAKKEKNYTLADKIRSELNKLGVVLEDSKEKTTYKITRTKNQAAN